MGPTKIVYVYAKDTAQDVQLLQQLHRHLAALVSQGLIQCWHAGLTLAGDNFQKQTDDALAWADLLLVLVSADCLSAPECLALVQRARALKRRVVPVLLRAVDTDHPLLVDTMPLPLDSRPVTSWPNRDEAFAEVARGLRQLLGATRPVAPSAPLIGAHTTGREALRIALRLDRSAQWSQVKDECAQRRHALFLLFGHKKQNLSFFLDRIHHYLAEERRDNHLVLTLPWDRSGEISLSGVDLLARLDQALALKVPGANPQVPLRDRLRQVTAMRPLLVIIGEHPLDELPSRRSRALADLLTRELPEVLRDLGTPHPVRILLCVDYLDMARSPVKDIAAWATKAAQRKKDPGLYYCQLPMAELPSWIDVEHFLQTLEPPLPPRRILKIRSKYDELQRMDSPNFYQIAQLLNTELGE